MFSRIPIWYLRRLCDGGPYEAAAKAELERRGTRHPSKVKLTAHAIDRASLQAMDLYHAYHDENEGIYCFHTTTYTDFGHEIQAIRTA